MFYDRNQNIIQSTYENVSKDKKIFKIELPMYEFLDVQSDSLNVRR